MRLFFLILHMVVAIALCGLILLQTSKGGLGSAFGGSLEQYRTKRGAERFVFLGTVVFVVIFLVTSILNLVMR